MFKLGFFVGRFQHIHKGHEITINLGLDLCEKFCILVSGSQRKGTSLNPYDVEIRKKLISKIYDAEIKSNKLIVDEIDDFLDDPIKNQNWGQHVLDTVEKLSNQKPDFLIYGDDSNRREWFNTTQKKMFSEFIVNLNNAGVTSATKMRHLLYTNNKLEWANYTNQLIHKDFDYLREVLLSCSQD